MKQFVEFASVTYVYYLTLDDMTTQECDLVAERAEELGFEIEFGWPDFTGMRPDLMDFHMKATFESEEPNPIDRMSLQRELEVVIKSVLDRRKR